MTTITVPDKGRIESWKESSVHFHPLFLFMKFKGCTVVRGLLHCRGCLEQQIFRSFCSFKMRMLMLLHSLLVLNSTRYANSPTQIIHITITPCCHAMPNPIRSVKLFTKTPRSCAHPYSSAFLPCNHQITPSPLTNHPKLNTVSIHIPSIIPNALFSIGPSAPLQVAQIKSDNGV